MSITQSIHRVRSVTITPVQRHAARGNRHYTTRAIQIVADAEGGGKTLLTINLFGDTAAHITIDETQR